MTEILAYGYANSTSCLRTIETLVFSYVEALSLMDDEMQINIPEGLFTAKQANVISIAAKDLQKTEHIMPCLV